MVKVTVNITAFKLTRSASLLKHTGVLLSIEPLFGGMEHELLGKWIHEVTGGTERGDSAAGKSVLVKRRELTSKDVFETQQDITKFQLNLADPEALKCFDDLFDYGHNYHLLFNNCRDHVLTFIKRLEDAGHDIHEDAVSFVHDIKKNDALVGGALAGVAVLGVVGIGLYKWWNYEENEKVEIASPSSSSAPSSSSSPPANVCGLASSNNQGGKIGTTSRMVNLTAISSDTMGVSISDEYPLPSENEVINAILARYEGVETLTWLTSKPARSTKQGRHAFVLTLAQEYVYDIVRRFPKLELS